MLFKLGLLTCAFYVLLTALFEAGLWVAANYKPFAIFFSGRHWFWHVGLRLGVVLGTMWIVSFAAAWSIVYQGLKSKFPFPVN